VPAIAVALAAPSGCALVGFDLGDYGGTSDGGVVDATVDGQGFDGVSEEALGGDALAEEGVSDADGSFPDGGAEVGPDAGPSDAMDEDGGSCSLSSVKRVFVTSVAYTVTQVASLSNANAICQKLASAHLFGRYLAWLSDDVTSAAQNLTHATVPYVLTDGVTLVACDWTELTSGSLRNAINKDESGAVAQTSPNCVANTELAVWTGTTPQGAIATGDTCASWTSVDPNASGVMGFAQEASSSWSAGCAGPICGLTGALYCVEQ
jgi:hypothetical protein